MSEIIYEDFSNLDTVFIEETYFWRSSMVYKFLCVHKYETKIHFNEVLFIQCMKDALADLNRVKEFHGMKNFDPNKIYSYVSAWFLRRKPLQLSLEAGEEYRYVNEFFVLTLFFNALKIDGNSSKTNSDESKSYFNRIFYHLKYRMVNPQILELLLNGICLGNVIEFNQSKIE